MKTISREGYSKSFEFDSPEYFEQHEGFEEIGENVYEAETRGESAIIIYDKASDIIDVVGDFKAVRAVQWNHRQEFGANAGFNNGVSEHYQPERPVESEAVKEALEEFGVETEGLEPEQKPRVVADGGRSEEISQEKYWLGNERFD
ncbi:MAG: hypothetical protein BRC30_03580 [Nanohaloarchaea archaeon SW_7_46_7]|nr:MAG: hypothetical protein BRC30_03580 [Nanohaloarchaea archaeon SW_7_46_7]